ncbi:MAG: hypothetical protein Q8S73_26980 [Deltaproteobacteria bacterium]|nr:hypothetical protein [Myxococcales bacterium]MDP3217782.1 hypothetical protein [Deltaproteobacteria bacterium]
MISRTVEAPRDLPSRALDRVRGADNCRPIEYQIFFMNLRCNAAARVAALVATRQ